jgi:hypothetical protein
MIRALFVAVALLVLAVGVAPTATADPYDDLRSMLPAGYNPGSCRTIDEQYEAVLAALACFDNSLPGGPHNAVYALYADPDRLVNDFSDALARLEIVPCPGGAPSPGDWGHGTTGAPLGQVACLAGKNKPEITWTKVPDRLFAHAIAPQGNLDSLYQWWRTNLAI